MKVQIQEDDSLNHFQYILFIMYYDATFYHSNNSENYGVVLLILHIKITLDRTETLKGLDTNLKLVHWQSIVELMGDDNSRHW